MSKPSAAQRRAMQFLVDGYHFGSSIRSSTITVLEDKGWVEYRFNTDSRIYEWVLTKAGYEALEQHGGAK